MSSVMSAAKAAPLSQVEEAAIAQAVETGVALHRRGLLDDAERLYAGILKLAPSHFDALHLTGVIRQQRGDSAAALEFIGAALEQNAASADALNNHGKVLLYVRRFDDALESIERALALAPDHVAALVNRATIRIEKGQFAGALADADHVLRIDSANVDGWSKRGNALTGLGRQREAVEAYDRALAVNPDHAEALNNRGCLLAEAGTAQEALDSYDRLLAGNPRHVEAWINRGHALVELHREEDGIASYEKARETGADHPDAVFNEGINRLRLGDFARGWTQYEWRWKAKDFTHTARRYPLPRWDGGAVAGPLLVSGEQGLGDQILFSSMLADAAARTPEITVEIEPRLIPLFARAFPDVKAVARETALYTGPAAAHIPMGSLGGLLRPDWSSFPRHDGGYLRCDAALAGQLRERLNDGRRVIGLSWWSKNPRYERSKSIALADFAPLLRLPDCRFIDLQYGDTGAERAAIARDFGVTIERLPDVDNSNDLDALAALIMACDAVVTVSNTTAHLAGALGQTTHVLVPSGRGRMWCWFRDRSDSPWYPHVRLARQKPGQPWAEIVAAVAAGCEAETG